jgi:hypothetical protein
VIVPMCQSPKIADFLLRANTAAANDNDRPADKSLRPLQSRRFFKASWQIPVILFCIIVFLVFELAGRL